MTSSAIMALTPCVRTLVYVVHTSNGIGATSAQYTRSGSIPRSTIFRMRQAISMQVSTSTRKMRGVNVR